MEEEDFRRLYWPIFRFFANRGYRREVAEELTQETFLEAHRNVASFRGDAALETWIFSIAKNVWRRHVRDHGTLKRRGEEVPLDSLEQSGSAMTSLEDPLRQSIEGEEIREMRAAMAELPNDQRRCLLLQFDQELPYREIAGILQISINQVRSLLFLARGKLKRRLAGPLADP